MKSLFSPIKYPKLDTDFNAPLAVKETLSTGFCVTSKANEEFTHNYNFIRPNPQFPGTLLNNRRVVSRKKQVVFQKFLSRTPLSFFNQKDSSGSEASILLPEDEANLIDNKSSESGTNVEKHGLKASSLPDDFFLWKYVDTAGQRQNVFLDLAGKIEIAPEVISAWVNDNIRCDFGAQVSKNISDALISDNFEIRDWFRGTTFEVENVQGLFVKKIYTFDCGGQKMVAKRIPRASQLSGTHRGFFVHLSYSYGKWKMKDDEKFELRPLMNLLMLKQMGEILNRAAQCDVFTCLLLPKIYSLLPDNDKIPIPKPIFYQVMPYVDTEIGIQEQILPMNADKIARLTANICNAACLANVLMQADCSHINVCFVEDGQGDISDVRLFDIDVVDPGDDGDVTCFYDCTNPRNFDVLNSEFHRTRSIGSCYDVRAALPPIVSKKVLDAICCTLPALRQTVVDYATPFEGKAPEVPFMLREYGIIDGWKDRVMVLTEDGKLYKNRFSSEYIKYDGSVALFILSKLHCVNDRLSLFFSMSFENLLEVYKSFVSCEKEEELERFFEDFTLESKFLDSVSSSTDREEL